MTPQRELREVVARAICISNVGCDNEWDIYKSDADAAIAALLAELDTPEMKRDVSRAMATKNGTVLDGEASAFYGRLAEPAIQAMLNAFKQEQSK